MKSSSSPYAQDTLLSFSHLLNLPQSSLLLMLSPLILSGVSIDKEIWDLPKNENQGRLLSMYFVEKKKKLFQEDKAIFY